MVVVLELIKDSSGALATQGDMRVHPEDVSGGKQAFIEESGNRPGVDYETLVQISSLRSERREQR